MESLDVQQVTAVIYGCEVGGNDRPTPALAYFVHVRLVDGQQWQGYIDTEQWAQCQQVMAANNST